MYFGHLNVILLMELRDHFYFKIWVNSVNIWLRVHSMQFGEIAIRPVSL